MNIFNESSMGYGTCNNYLLYCSQYFVICNIHHGWGLNCIKWCITEIETVQISDQLWKRDPYLFSKLMKFTANYHLTNVWTCFDDHNFFSANCQLTINFNSDKLYYFTILQNLTKPSASYLAIPVALTQLVQCKHSRINIIPTARLQMTRHALLSTNFNTIPFHLPMWSCGFNSQHRWGKFLIFKTFFCQLPFGKKINK